MKLTLNNCELEGFLDDEATLGEALTMVQQERLNDDQVVAAIWVDGEPLTAERLSIWKDRSVDDFSEATIEAPGRKTYAAQGLRTIAAKLHDSAAQREELTDHFSQGRANEGLAQFTDYLQVWSTVQQSLASVGRMLELDFDTLEFQCDAAAGQSTETVGEQIEKLSEQLSEVKSALGAHDMVLLSDILDYEFPDLTHAWTDMLNQLAQDIDPAD